MKDKLVTSLWETDKTETRKRRVTALGEGESERRGRSEIASWHFSWKGCEAETVWWREREREVVSTVAEWTFAQCLSLQRTAEDEWCECVCVCHVYMCVSLPPLDSEEEHEVSNCSGDCNFRPLPQWKGERQGVGGRAEQHWDQDEKRQKVFVTARRTKWSHIWTACTNLQIDK